MELRLNIGYQQIFNLVMQLSALERKKLIQEINEKLIEKKLKPKKREFGVLKGEIWMADDFDAPLDDFKEYMP